MVLVFSRLRLFLSRTIPNARLAETPVGVQALAESLKSDRHAKETKHSGEAGAGGLGLAGAGLGLVYLRVLTPAKTTLHHLWNFRWTFSACERSLTYLSLLVGPGC